MRLHLVLAALLAFAASGFQNVQAAKTGSLTSAVTEKPAAAADSQTKAGVSGARRYHLLFGPDLDVIGALKIAPDVSLTITAPTGTSLPWIPVQASPITLGATIQYIGASEIQSVQFLLDGNPITTCTPPNSNYESSCTFSAAQVGARTLKVRVTDTDGKPTDSAAVSVELVNSQVLGSIATSGTDWTRYVEGWVCSTGYSTPLQVSLGTSSSPQAIGTYTANATNYGSSTLPQCKSNGTALGFKILITSAMYANYSDVPLKLEVTPAAPGQFKASLNLGAINTKPTVGAPSVSAGSPANGGQYLPGDVVTLTASLSNDDGFAKVEYFDSLNSSALICTQSDLPAGSVLSQCSFTLSAGSHQYYARATDKRSVVGPASSLSIAITTGSRGSLIFSAANSSVSEAGGQATISVARVGGSAGPVSVQYATSNGSAIQPGDYSASSGTLSWATNDSVSKTFTVPIVNDTANESDETITLTLSAPQGGATLSSPSSATLTILDDDAAVTLVRPTAGSSIPTDQAILLEASVVNTGVTIARVEFVADGNLTVGQATVPPYVAVWNEVPKGDGTYEIKAWVYFTSGQPKASSPVTISVIDGLPEACPIPVAKSGLIQSLVEMLRFPANLAPASLSIEPPLAETEQ